MSLLVHSISNQIDKWEEEKKMLEKKTQKIYNLVYKKINYHNVFADGLIVSTVFVLWFLFIRDLQFLCQIL